MSDTLLERCRKLHSEAEQLKKLAARALMRDTKGFRDQLRTDEVVHGRLQRVVENSDELLRVYDDKDDMRADELREMQGREVFKVFYSKIKDMKKPNASGISLAPKPEEVDVQIHKQWAGTEWHGRFIDLTKFHQDFNNLNKKVKNVSYKKYLRTFAHFHRITEKNPAYKRYLLELLAYIVDFWDRQNPLYPSSRVLELNRKAFEERWKKNSIQGYQLPYDIKSLEELEAKSAGSQDAFGPQMNDPLPDPELFCVESQKWFVKKEALEAHKRGKKFKKRKKAGPEQHKSLAKIESHIALFAGLLEETIHRSVDFVDKRLTKTYEEIKREIDEAEAAIESSEDEEDEEDLGVIYNPLKIPLDFDGKPIPYWLYKFRGLNRYFKCQICGNREYRGPMAFEQHFSEWRHAHGMRTLGIPNTKDFMWITDIEDAIALWGKIKDRKKDAVWNPADEEVEDIDGNVFNRPTYENLHYQNLIQV